jgi:hypothetical protein
VIRDQKKFNITVYESHVITTMNVIRGQKNFEKRCFKLLHIELNSPLHFLGTPSRAKVFGYGSGL